MRVNFNKMKRYGATALMWIGAVILSALFWWLLRVFMWVCYDAGIPM